MFPIHRYIKYSLYVRHLSARQLTRDGCILMTRHVARYHARRDAAAMHARDG